MLHPTSAVMKDSDWRRPGIGGNLGLVMQQTARTEKGLPLQDTPEVAGIIAFRTMFSNPFDY